MKILIYHHQDNDGYLAAAIAWQHFSYGGYHDIKFRVGKYNGKHDIEALTWADHIYVLDYSLPPALMDRFRNKIVWIDHHHTAIETLGDRFDGLRAIGKSGCLLTWQWFYPQLNIPLVITLVNDRDVWDWKYGDDTAAFHEISTSFMESIDDWCRLLRNDSLVKEKVKKGHLLLSHIRSIVDSYNKSYAWETVWEGYPVVMLNGTVAISGELHKRLREQHPNTAFAVSFMIRREKVTVGLYRRDGESVDLGRIAQRYGGGGHAGAAGFSTTVEEWFDILKTLT